MSAKTFRILVRGSNFLLMSEGAAKRFGFYTTRFVEAADDAEAERLAVATLRQDEKLRERVLNDRSDPPMLFAEEIAALLSLDVIEHPTPGLAFYEERPTEH